MKVLFIDESGDHNLAKIDPRYPIFVLGGVIVDRKTVNDDITASLNDLKEEFFGRESVVLHTAEIARPKGLYAPLLDEEIRLRFYDRLNSFVEAADFKVVACVIDKQAHHDRYGSNAWDPYHFALEVLVERFVKEIGDVEDGGIIVAERRGNELDSAIEKAWMDLCKSGTYFTPAEQINRRVVDLVLRSKHLNITGLQLADLIVTPVGRFVTGKEPKKDWEIVQSKFCRRSWGGYEGFGLVRLPRKR